VGRAIASAAGVAKAAAVIDPAVGVKPRLGEKRLAAGEEALYPTGDSLVSARRAVLGHAGAGLDRSEPDDLGELAHRLEQGPATRAEITDQVSRSCRAVQAGLARYALEVGHQGRFDRYQQAIYMLSKSRNDSLPYMRHDGTPGWSFLTNHAQVLLCIAHDPGIRLREIGDAVGITERAAHRIVAELAAAGYIARRRNGRRNHYTIKSHLPLPDPVARDQKIGDLLAILAGHSPTETNG